MQVSHCSGYDLDKRNRQKKQVVDTVDGRQNPARLGLEIEKKQEDIPIRPSTSITTAKTICRVRSGSRRWVSAIISPATNPPGMEMRAMAPIMT